MTSGAQPMTAAAAVPAALVAAARDALVVIDSSDASADLAWAPVKGAISYRVSRASVDSPFAIVGQVTGPSFGDARLTPNTTYLWRGSKGQPQMRFAGPHDPRPLLATIQDLAPSANENRRRCASAKLDSSAGRPIGSRGTKAGRLDFFGVEGQRRSTGCERQQTVQKSWRSVLEGADFVTGRRHDWARRPRCRRSGCVRLLEQRDSLLDLE